MYAEDLRDSSILCRLVLRSTNRIERLGIVGLILYLPLLGDREQGADSQRAGNSDPRPDQARYGGARGSSNQPRRNRRQQVRGDDRCKDCNNCTDDAAQRALAWNLYDTHGHAWLRPNTRPVLALDRVAIDGHIKPLG